MICPAQPGRVCGSVPERPSVFVAQVEDLDRVRAEVVAGLSSAVGVAGTPSAFGLHSRGGIGKTVMARSSPGHPYADIFKALEV